MFVRTLAVERLDEAGVAFLCPVKWIDSFAMRNFTNDAVFDDTLPTGDGRLEAGLRVPIALLEERMDVWFRRKGYLRTGEQLRITELEGPCRQGGSS
jgi:hypothetical protein